MILGIATATVVSAFSGVKSESEVDAARLNSNRSYTEEAAMSKARSKRSEAKANSLHIICYCSRMMLVSQEW